LKKLLRGEPYREAPVLVARDAAEFQRRGEALIGQAPGPLQDLGVGLRALAAQLGEIGIELFGERADPERAREEAR
jgi:hypothetical protein